MEHHKNHVRTKTCALPQTATPPGVFAGGHGRPRRVGRIWAKPRSRSHSLAHTHLRPGSAACVTLKAVPMPTVENVKSTVKAAVPGSNCCLFYSIRTFLHELRQHHNKSRHTWRTCIIYTELHLADVNSTTCMKEKF